MRSRILIIFSLFFFIQRGSTQLPELLLPISHSGSLQWMMFADADRLIVSYGKDNTLKVWDIRTGWLRYTMGDDSFAITQAIPTPDNAVVLACSDGALRKIGISTGVIQLTISSLRPDLVAATLSDDGYYVATADKRGDIVLFDLRSGAHAGTWKLDYPLSKIRVRFRRQAGSGLPTTHLLADLSQPLVAVWDIKARQEIYQKNGLRSSLVQNNEYFAATKGDSALAVSWITGEEHVVGRNFFGFKQDMVERRDSIARQLPNVQRALRARDDIALHASADTQWVLIATPDSIFGIQKNIVSIRWSKPFQWGDVFTFSTERDGQPAKYVAVRQRDRNCALIELPTGRIVLRYVSGSAPVFSGDQLRMVTENQGRIQMHDLERGLSRSPSGNAGTSGAVAAAFGGNNAFGFPEIYIACGDSTLRRFRLAQLQDTILLRAPARIRQLLAVPSSGLVALSYGTTMEHSWEADTSSTVAIVKSDRSPLVKIRSFHSAIQQLNADAGGRFVAGAGKDDLFLWSVQDGKVRRRKIGGIRALALDSAQQRIAVARSSKISFLDFDTLQTKWDDTFLYTVHALAWSPNGQYFAYVVENQIRVREVAQPDKDYDSSYHFFNDKRYRSGVSHGSEVQQLRFSSDGRWIVSASKDRTAKLWDFASRKLLMIFSHTTAVLQASLSEDGVWLLTTAADGLVRLWRTGDGKLALTIVVLPEGAVVVQTPEQYYYSSRNAAHGLRWKLGKHFLAFDQLDLLYNRPHRVLAAIGGGDPKLLALYQKAFSKRVRRFGFDTSLLHSIVPPDASLPGSDTIAFQRDSKWLPIRVSAYDSLHMLASLHVWINEVPLFGSTGHSLAGRNRPVLDSAFLLPLSVGDNHIEFSVVNNEGVESYRSTLLVHYSPPQIPASRFHFVGIGIDRFADTRYNLRYSAKDIRDLCTALRKRHGAALVVDTLFNEQITPEAVERLRAKLLGTDVGDKVLLAYSGHGLVGKDQEFFLSSFNVRFDAPEQGGIPYTQLEALLDSIPARQKLLLLDACHSGEIDRDTVPLIALRDSILQTGAKGIRAAQRASTLSAFELMQQAFANTLRRSGTAVLSASAGTQQALERTDLHNGVFTWSILEWMRMNPKGKVHQLCRDIPARVAGLTKGIQVPVLRNENYLLDWSL